MRQLICYSLEGLRRQGWREVWVTLGTYETEASAAAAAAGTALDAELVATRVLPYYRVSPPLALARNESSVARQTLSA